MLDNVSGPDYLIQRMNENTLPKKQRLTPLKALELTRQGIYDRLEGAVHEFIQKAALGNSARRAATSVEIPIKTIRCAAEDCDILVEKLREAGWQAEVRVKVNDDPSATGGRKATPYAIFVDWSQAKPRV